MASNQRTQSIRTRRIWPLLTASAFVNLFFAEPAQAQISLGIGSSGTVCYTVQIYVSDNNDDCQSGLILPTTFDVASPANFYGTVDFNSTTVQFSGLQAFSGTTAFNSNVTVNNNMTTNGISNTGLITSGSLSSNTIFGNSATITNILSANGSFTDSLSVIGAATIDMGGNIIHGVAAGVAGTDAVNVSQLNAATSGIAADISALETTTATHTTQIANLETTTATHTTQIAEHTTQISGLQTTTATHTAQITAIETVNATQSGQISALEAAQDLVSGSIDTLFDLRSRDRRDMKQGVAAAMSMASAPMPSEPGRIAYAVNGASFRGEYAVGGSLQYRLNTRAPMAIGVGFSYAGNKNNGVRLGVAGEF